MLSAGHSAIRAQHTHTHKRAPPPPPPPPTHTPPQVKSWNGNTAADGVLEGSRGYALMRRSVLEEHQRAQAQAAQ